jgi:deazaflavin-dependent oxidoreductase (nitroreductase family)
MRRHLMIAAGALNTFVYRLSAGRLMGRFPSGAPVCLLTTKGRRSGRPRTVPLLYLKDGSDYVVVASQGGAPRHPDWFLNLEADPHAKLEIGTHRFKVIARRVGEEERAALWPRVVAMYRPYEAYQRCTSRRIPLVRLRPES